MKLTNEQITIIENRINTHQFKVTSLRDDIVDHLCCVIESELEDEQSFSQLLENAIQDIAPEGLDDIDQKTVFLLNSKRIILMKKLMYSIGLFGSVTLTAGVTFKLLRMPMGSELFMIGFITLLLLFIPLLAIDNYKVALSKALSVRLKIILGASAAITTGLSGLFKIMHLQGAEVLLMLGAMLFAFGFLPFLFFTMYKKSVALD